MGSSPDIFGYISESLTSAEKDELYTDSLSAMSVFRSLEPLGQQVVLRMLLPDCDAATALGLRTPSPGQPSPWAGDGNLASLASLEKLRVWIRTPADSFHLNPSFRKALMLGLQGDGCVEPSKKQKAQDPGHISEYAWLVWEGVLKYMVGNKWRQEKDGGAPILPGMADLLENTELIRRTEGRAPQITQDFQGRAPQITQEGFQFLLKDVYAQLWIVLRQYLKDYADAQRAQGFDKLKVLQFLFHLGYCKVGQAYPLKALDPLIQQIVRTQLPNFGLVFIPGNKETKELSRKNYYVTPLGLHLTSHSKARPLFRNPEQQETSTGYIIVETNYRVYAYIDTRRNPLQVALLNLFVDVQYCLPNLAVGTITRESVLNALRAGISANQLLGYLYQRAHPEMQKNNPVIPETVVDQVRLWETERNRIKAQAGTLYRNFASENEYQLYKDEATKDGGLLHHNDSKQMLVVTRECEERLGRLRDRR